MKKMRTFFYGKAKNIDLQTNKKAQYILVLDNNLKYIKIKIYMINFNNCMNYIFCIKMFVALIPSHVKNKICSLD